MASFNELAYNLLNLIRGGRSTNSEVLSLEQIKFNILYYRALILRRDAERGTNLLPFEQTLPLELDFVDPVFPEPSGALFSEPHFNDVSITLARSVREIPSPLRLSKREAVSYVGHPYYGGSYPLIQLSQVAPLLHSRYTSLSKRSFLANGYLYLLNPSPETGEMELMLRGVFEDPRKAHDFAVTERALIDETDASLTSFWSDDTTEFPCSLDVYQRIVQALLSGELKAMPDAPDTSLNEQP